MVEAGWRGLLNSTLRRNLLQHATQTHRCRIPRYMVCVFTKSTRKWTCLYKQESIWQIIEKKCAQYILCFAFFSQINSSICKRRRNLKEGGRNQRRESEVRGDRKGESEQWCQTKEHWSSDGCCPLTIRAFEGGGEEVLRVGSARARTS